MYMGVENMSLQASSKLMEFITTPGTRSSWLQQQP